MATPPLPEVPSRCEFGAPRLMFPNIVLFIQFLSEQFACSSHKHVLSSGNGAAAAVASRDPAATKGQSHRSGESYTLGAEVAAGGRKML